MPTSPAQQARRSLVRLLLELALKYAVVLALTRDSPDQAVLEAFRKVARRAHPDKGGLKEEMQRLNDAKDVWDAAKKKGPGKRQKPAASGSN